MPDESPLLLYDGTCGFCAESVQFVLRHERQRRTLRFAALEGETGSAIRERHPNLDGVDSVIWYERSESDHETLLVRSAAVLRVWRYLGGGWRVLSWLGSIVPRVARDALYDLVARHRHRLLRGGDACLVPTAEQRSRFV